MVQVVHRYALLSHNLNKHADGVSLIFIHVRPGPIRPGKEIVPTRPAAVTSYCNFDLNTLQFDPWTNPYDPKKAATNLRKHAEEFDGFEAIFDGPFMDVEDRSADYGEERRHVIGFLRGEFVHLTYTERDEKTRPISLRKAERHEIEQLRHYLHS